MKKKDLYYERIPTKLLREDVKYLGNILGQVIRTQEGQKFFDLEKLHNYLKDKDKAEFIVRRIEYFDGTQYVVDVTKAIEIEDVDFLTF